MSWYLPQAAAPDVADVLACGWTASAGGEHLLVPDARILLDRLENTPVTQRVSVLEDMVRSRNRPRDRGHVLGKCPK